MLEISTCLLTNADEQTWQGWLSVLSHLSSAVSKKYYIFLTFSMKLRYSVAYLGKENILSIKLQMLVWKIKLSRLLPVQII